MTRLWLAALGAAAVMACGDDSSGGGDPNEQFPDVAGVYDVEGEFDGVDPEVASFTGTITLEQESLESSVLTGTASLAIHNIGQNDVVITSAELQNAAVSLAGVVAFTVEQGAITWDFTGERAGDILEGDHTLVQGAESQSGTWSGIR
jgi:hypothetical protein